MRARAVSEFPAWRSFFHATRSHALRDVLAEVLSRSAALVLLIVLSPVLLAVALAVWWVDGGAVLYGHYRVGRHGKLFPCLKFRTMALDAEQRLTHLLANDAQARTEWSQQRKLSRDPRVTRLGNLLRRSSLDELPQLINVVRGDMVLVGPRPITYDELHLYGPVRWHYLSVLPGITGLWQVSGRNHLTYEERVQMDRDYVESRSLGLDLKILLRTVGVVIRADGVY